MMTASRLDATAIKDQARWKWRGILTDLGTTLPATAKQHGPCPTCGGTDRFRFDDQDGNGTWFCNQCMPQAGDGFTLVQNVRGCDFPHALQLVADALGCQPSHGDKLRKIGAEYNYADTNGGLLFQVVRFIPKDFRQRRPDGHGGWIWNLTGIEPVLYRLPEAHKADLVLIVEGEKDVETAYRLGFPDGWGATCNPMGAGKWRESYSDALQGKHVVILPDADEPGEKHAVQVAQSLQGKAATVLRLTLPDGVKDLSVWAVDRTQADFHDLLSQAAPWNGGQTQRGLDAVRVCIENATSQATAPPEAPTTASRAIFRRMTDVQAKPIRWLWPGRIAQGKVSIIAGNPGLGKSQVTVGMAATVSTGGLWPVGGERCEVGNVIILSAEDDPSDTIRPRLEAAGADLSRVYILDAVLDGPLVAGSETPRAFNLKTDIDQLGSMLKEIGGAALVIIDPITAYLGTTDSHKNAEIRALLSPLAELAGQYGAAVVAVSHFNKNANTEALMRVTGSLAFVAAARAAYVVARDPEHEARRLLLPLKNNLGNDQTGLAFTVESAQVESSIGMIETSRVVWESSVVTVTADEAMKPQDHDDERDDLDDAKDFLCGLLGDGPVPSKQIRGDAEGAGHAWRTIQRAKKVLGIVAVKKGMKEGWFWQLDTPLRPEDRHEPTKNAVPDGWQPSYSSGGLGGLRGDDMVPVEGGGLDPSPQIAATSETPGDKNLYADDLMEVIDLDT